VRPLRIGRVVVVRVLPLAFLLPLAYLLRPVLWAPLDFRSYNYFHSKRPVPPWTEVVVVGIDRATRDSTLSRPVFPISRHEEQHALLTRRLDQARARAIAFDLSFDTESFFGHRPDSLAAAFRASGKVSLVTAVEDAQRFGGPRGTARIIRSLPPDSLLLASSQGAFLANVQLDPDGTLRRFDPSIAPLGLETLPEHLAGRRFSRAVPIEFPSLERPMPIVSYRDVLDGRADALARVEGKIVLVGAVDVGTADEVVVPRRQDLGDGRTGFRLPGCVALAAVTETLCRGAPLRDARPGAVLAWNLAWSLVLVGALPRGRPVLAAFLALLVGAAAIVVTGWLHARASVVLPAGLLFGCLLIVGSFTLISFHLETSKRLAAEEADNRRIHRELMLARETQTRFLPQDIPSLPGLDVWGTNISSLEVSGDYYDVQDPGAPRPLVVAIADVSGKGLPAAMLMSVVQAGLHTMLVQDRFDLTNAMQTLNRVVHGNVRAEQYVTMLLVTIERDARSLRYVLAGHEGPLLLSGAGEMRRLEDGGGFPLGMFPEASYDMGSAALAAGDVLCLYTDGITEAMDREETFFGAERLREVLLAHRAESAAEIGESILAAVQEHARGVPQADDITLVVVRVIDQFGASPARQSLA
jgi:serine phosphatase RsbU (regulator of sigma subunit)/CHASE2 domain-containing sensor protein